MKSLEIVNEKVKYYKDTIEELLNKNEEYPNPFIHLTLDPLEEKLKQWETIKQDLEVLEILNNKNVELGFLKFLLSRETDLNEILEGYNYGGIGKKYLSMEELLKLKQWLEG